MSAPPLPDAFGNYALGDFVEVTAPQPVSWLPQTVGWWWLGALLLGVGLYQGWKFLRHWYRNRYRREAAARLRQLSQTAGDATLVGEVNRLLKLTALAAFSRDRVARLSGDEWVTFLNGLCPDPPFGAEQSRLLALGAYREEAVDAASRRRLITASLVWVREHEAPRGD